MSVYITRDMVRRASYADRHYGEQSILAPFARFLSRAWRQRRAIAALEALDDHMLRDIGLERADIREAVRDSQRFRAGAARRAALRGYGRNEPRGGYAPVHSTPA